MVTARGTVDARALALSAPPRTLLGKINSHLICVLCRGYYIDATTIVECLHTFCRSCIIKHLREKSYCPVCEVMINSARPNIKLDKALQDIVYKLVPGLFQREMARRRSFYASQPHLAADVTPEQRGEDMERVIFSPDDVISFSLEYVDSTDLETISSRSSESGSESASQDNLPTISRRYLRCPAVVNISHLKKFISLKFDIDAAHFFVDILYKRVPLPDYYTLMDVAYIYNWKRVEPMRFFYQINDFSSIRDKFGFLDRRGDGTRGNGERSPSTAEGGAPGSPAHPLTEPSDGSTGNRTPPLHNVINSTKSQGDFSEVDDKSKNIIVIEKNMDKNSANPSIVSDTPETSDVEKSQFLNSFELTAKHGLSKTSISPIKDEPKSNKIENNTESKLSHTTVSHNGNISLKRKLSTSEENPPENKKEKQENSFLENSSEKKSSNISNSSVLENLLTRIPVFCEQQNQQKNNVTNGKIDKPNQTVPPILNPPLHKQNIEPHHNPLLKIKKPVCETRDKFGPDAAKKSKTSILKALSMKRKLNPADGESSQSKVEQPLKIPSDVTKDLNIANKNDKPFQHVPIDPKVNQSVKANAVFQVSNDSNMPKVDIPKKKTEITHKLMSIKTKKSEGDNPLKSLFNSCNINIPPSLSITLKDQDIMAKMNEISNEIIMDSRKNEELSKPDVTQPVQNPQLPVTFEKNYLEIIKLPDAENQKIEQVPQNKSAPSVKSMEPIVTAKGPIPNLKPISEAKLSPIAKPQTFQQTFLQSLQQKEKPKFTKMRFVQYSKSDDTESVTLKPGSSLLKSKTPPLPPQTQKTNIYSKNLKSDSALDLSTPHPVQSKLGPQQTKALETMQSIAYLATKQCQRPSPSPQNFNQDSFKMNPNSCTPLRVPIPNSSNQLSKLNIPQSGTNSPKHFSDYFPPLKQMMIRSPNENNSNQVKPQQQTSINNFNQNERLQNRSPSSSPKLVIACPSPKSQSPEQKHFLSPRRQDSNSQSNLISSSQISSSNISNSESTSKDITKSLRNVKSQASNKLSTVRNPNTNSLNNQKSNDLSNTPNNDVLLINPLLAQQAYIQQLQFQSHLGMFPPSNPATQWYNNSAMRAHFESLVKNMAQNATQSQYNYNNTNTKEK